MTSKSTKKTFKKRRQMKKRPTTLSLAKRIHNIETSQELKYIDQYEEFLMYFQPASSPTRQNLYSISPLNDITGGVGPNQVIGDEIRPTSLQWRSTLVFSGANSSATTIGPAYMRRIIFWDRQPNGETGIPSNATPLLAGNPDQQPVLDTSVILNNYLAPYCRQTQERYKILSDRTFKGEPVGLTASQVSGSNFIWTTSIEDRGKIKLSRKVKYNLTTPSQFVSNMLWIGYVYSTEYGNSTCDCVIATRLYFKDD